LLIAAATVALVLLESKRDPWRMAAAAPLLVVPLHLVWRWRMYGDWLPNTYRAKFGGAWPESGLRYLGCFVIEYGVWLWLIFASVFVVRQRSRPAADPRAIPILVLLAHLAYYTFIIGGDHFEFRVYSHLILLLFVSGAWLCAQITERGSTAIALLAAFVVSSFPIPWAHWAATQRLQSRAQTQVLILPIADRFPWPANAVVSVWDRWQAWLISHHVCMRHQEHKAFQLAQARSFPTRAEGAQIAWEDSPVIAGGTVGVPGWVLPNVAIIDTHGLNDRVVARTPPVNPPEQRLMAHEHRPPPGYVDCFRPNVVIQNRSARVIERAQPLTDDDIRRCESQDWPPLPPEASP